MRVMRSRSRVVSTVAAALVLLVVIPQALASAGSWVVVPTPNQGSDANYLTAVSALAPGDGWAVGSFRDQASSQFRTLAEHWNGTKWSLVDTPNRNWGYNELYDVAGSSKTDVWAVGYDNAGAYGTERTLIEHWDGAGWSIVPSPNIGSGASVLYGIAVAAPNDVWAVGVGNSRSSESGKVLVARWNGSAWKRVKTPSTHRAGSELIGVDVVTTNDVWAVGGAGKSTLVEHWDGSKWRVVPSPNGSSGSSVLSAVTALSANDVWAVGSTESGTLTEHWNGTSWSVVPSPNGDLPESYLGGVAGFSANDVWAVGASYDPISGSGPTLSLHWDGSSWTRMATPSPDPDYDFLVGITRVPAAQTIWAVGGAGGKTLALRTGPP
jgi:hypothetical protein